MNWGNKLLLAFIGFAGGMSFLVYKSVKTNFELVEKDYYKSEIAYQQVIDGTKRANELQTELVIKQYDKQVAIVFPAELKEKEITGTVWFYCSYDQSKDQKMNVQSGSSAGEMMIRKKIMPGNYTVKIKWHCDGKDYYAEKYITIS